MQFEEITAIVGKAINDPSVVAFMDKYEYGWPEKGTISNRAGDRNYWAYNMDGPSLLFKLEVYNPNYQPSEGEKGEFYPVLTMVDFSMQDIAMMAFPFDISLQTQYEDLKEKLGEPTRIWFEEEEQPMHDWELPLENDHIFFVRYHMEDKAVVRISVMLKEHKTVFILYDPLLYENIETFEQKNHNRIFVLYFIRWAIENHFITETQHNRELLREIRVGQTAAIEYLRSLGRGYVAKHDFNAQHVFIQKYIPMGDGDDIEYYNDVVRLFIADKEMLRSYFGKKAQDFLDAYDWNEDAYQKVKSKISERLAAFNHTMQFEEITALLGKGINDPSVAAFANKYKYQWPKKLPGFNRISNRHHMLYNVEGGPYLRFNLMVDNPDYRAQEGEKGEFYPILTTATFSYPDCSGMGLPFAISSNSSYENIVNELGEPTVVEAGYDKQVFYGWELLLKNDHVFFLRYEMDSKTVNEISVKLKEHKRIFNLYDPLSYADFGTFEQTKFHIRIPILYFMRWAIENDFIMETENNKILLREIREGKTAVNEYLRSLQRGYVAEHDFNVQQVFIRQYIHALIGEGIGYYNDFSRLFITNKELVSNHFSKETQDFLNAYDWNEEAYDRVKSMISERLTGFENRQE